jgi:hypothetical protein
LEHVKFQSLIGFRLAAGTGTMRLTWNIGRLWTKFQSLLVIFWNESGVFQDEDRSSWTLPKMFHFDWANQWSRRSSG